jgi:HTH-type transcriptional regulator/antitoxin HipB
MSEHETPATVAARIGTQVAARRKEFGLTQHDLAELAGVSIRLINSVEHGKPTTQLDGVVSTLNALGLELVAVRRSR